MATTYTNLGPIYLTQEKFNTLLETDALEAGREYKIIDWEAQEKLVAGTNITIAADGKTISAASPDLSSYATQTWVNENYSTVALKPMKDEWLGWDTQLTTEQAAEAILNDEDTKVGDGFLGGVAWSDLDQLGLGNAEVKAFVVADGIIQFEMTSGSTPPYAWFFNSLESVWRSYVPIANDLTTDDENYALSAKQGKALNDNKQDKLTAGTGIDITNNVISIDDNAGIAIYDERISDANSWLTNGYTKTRNTTDEDEATANLPSVCTGNDRWGVLLYVAENNSNHAGLQQYFPIDGTYKGRVFYRSVTGYGDDDEPSFGEWNMVPWSAEKQDKLTAGTGITISNNTISANQPVLQADLTTEIAVGGVAAGTTFAAGTSIESILVQLFTSGSTPTGTKYVYYGVVDSIPNEVSELTSVAATKDDLLENGYTWRSINTSNQYAVFAIDKSLGLNLDDMQQSGFSLEFTTVDLGNQYLYYANKSTDTNAKIVFTFYEE